VLDFCRRAFVSEELAQRAAQAAAGEQDRLARLAWACAAGRELLAEQAVDSTAPAAENSTGDGAAPVDGGGDRSLQEAVAQEMQAANALLAERHREALALREHLGLTHEQIARVMGIEPAAVAAILARARLALRTARRGPLPAQQPCSDSERALAALARQQDGEEISDQEVEWLLDHLRDCRGCEHAHAAMLEASACYRGWRQTAADTASR